MPGRSAQLGAGCDPRLPQLLKESLPHFQKQAGHRTVVLETAGPEGSTDLGLLFHPGYQVGTWSQVSPQQLVERVAGC